MYHNLCKHKIAHHYKNICPRRRRKTWAKLMMTFFFCVDIFHGWNTVVVSFVQVVDITSTKLPAPIKSLAEKTFLATKKRREKDIFVHDHHYVRKNRFSDHKKHVDRKIFLSTIIITSTKWLSGHVSFVGRNYLSLNGFCRQKENFSTH